jgi:hypothetical protein
MKKGFAIFLAAVLALSICGCGKAKPEDETGKTSGSTTAESPVIERTSLENTQPSSYEEPPKQVAYGLVRPVDRRILRIIFSAKELEAFVDEMTGYFGEGENFDLFMEAADKYRQDFFEENALVFLTFEKSLKTGFDDVFFQFTLKEPPGTSGIIPDGSRLVVVIAYNSDVQVYITKINSEIDAAAFLTVDRELVAGFGPNDLTVVNNQW